MPCEKSRCIIICSLHTEYWMQIVCGTNGSLCIELVLVRCTLASFCSSLEG